MMVVMSSPGLALRRAGELTATGGAPAQRHRADRNTRRLCGGGGLRQARREGTARCMTAIDYELEYNNRARVPEHVEILARWRAASAADRQVARAELDLAYGPGARHRYDLYRAGDPAAPLVVYIHGGYWQFGSGPEYAFVARALTAAGLDVAVPTYTLCPEASVMQIVGDLRRFLPALWSREHKHPVVIGHSAGGHLTAAMLATDWRAVPGAPADLVRAGCAISGVFELAPLISTTINQALRLDAGSAAEASPLAWPLPARRTLVAAVGTDESAEFQRQTRAITEVWARGGATTELLPVAGANHFTVLDALTDPNSALLRRIAALAGSAPA
jgi:arylformamidase